MSRYPPRNDSYTFLSDIEDLIEKDQFEENLTPYSYEDKTDLEIALEQNRELLLLGHALAERLLSGESEQDLRFVAERFLRYAATGQGMLGR